MPPGDLVLHVDDSKASKLSTCRIIASNEVGNGSGDVDVKFIFVSMWFSCFVLFAPRLFTDNLIGNLLSRLFRPQCILNGV
jgi:hypothetical protein